MAPTLLGAVRAPRVGIARARPEPVLLAAEQAAQVRRVPRDDEDRDPGDHHHVEREPPIATTAIGAAIAHTSDATDALCSPRAITNHTSARPTVTNGYTTRNTPAPVATPRPPLNRRHTGNTWPSTAATPRM